MPIFHFTVTEHDAERPWIVVGEIQRLSVDLEPGIGFFDWASQEWPGPRYTVELAPWELSRERG